MNAIEKRAAAFAYGDHEAVCHGCQYWRSLGYVKGAEEQIEIDKEKVKAFWEREFIDVMPEDEKDWAYEKLQELLDALDDKEAEE